MINFKKSNCIFARNIELNVLTLSPARIEAVKTYRLVMLVAHLSGSDGCMEHQWNGSQGKLKYLEKILSH